MAVSIWGVARNAEAGLELACKGVYVRRATLHVYRMIRIIQAVCVGRLMPQKTLT